LVPLCLTSLVLDDDWLCGHLVVLHLGQQNPERAVEKAIAGMVPKTTLGRNQLSKLKVYRGAEHPHAAQQPQQYVIDQVAQ
jgi:large subunit ribosomal protein L13